MSDVFQSGSIASLHNLGLRDVASMEHELLRLSKRRKMTLIIPALYSELEKEALTQIVSELSQVPYLSSIIIGLDQADRDQFLKAQSFFSRLPQECHLLWHDGPRLKALHEELATENLSPSQPGKGRNVWYCLGFAAICQNSDVVAVHDADITTYDRGLLSRLFWPIAKSTNGYRFCKAYYARSDGEHLGGRVNRLFVAPLLHALKRILGPLPYLEFLSSFRYPLSGEFSVTASDIMKLRIPPNWGLEIGILSEIWRNINPSQVCQADICDRYDHKHQPLSSEEASAGLARMSSEIALSMYRKLATEGIVLQSEHFRTLKAAYLRSALDMIHQYQTDALFNGLHYSYHDEEFAVETFSRSIISAGNDYLDNPFDPPFIPNWNRVISALPHLPEALCEAVARDAQEP